MHPDCVAAAEAAGRLLESLGHEVDVSHPKALDDPDYTGHFITNWAAGAAWNLDYWTRRTGDEIGPTDVEPLTWALAEVGRSSNAADWLWAREWLQVERPRDRRLVDRGPRPAPHAHDRRAAAAAGHLRQPAGQPAPRPVPRRRGRPVHPALQRHGPARHLAAAALERRRPADRRAARGRLRSGGRAAPRRRPARGRRSPGPTGGLLSTPSATDASGRFADDGGSHPTGGRRQPGPSAASPWSWSLLGLVAYVLRVIWPPLILAGAIVFLLNPVVTRLQARHIPRALGTGLSYLGVVAATVLVDPARRAARHAPVRRPGRSLARAARRPRGGHQRPVAALGGRTSGRSASPPGRSWRTSSPPRTPPTPTATA